MSGTIFVYDNGVSIKEDDLDKTVNMIFDLIKREWDYKQITPEAIEAIFKRAIEKAKACQMIL